MWRTVLRAPWATPTWRGMAHLVTGAGYGVAVLVAGFAIGRVLSGHAGKKPAVIPWCVGVLLVTVVAARWLTAAHRARFEMFLGVRLARAPRRTGPRAVRLADRLASGQVWREIGYHLVGVLVGTPLAAGLVAAWVIGLVLVVGPLVQVIVPKPAILTVFASFEVLAGVALVFAGAWCARGFAALDVWLARSLLEPSRSEELARRVATLSASRAGAVDAADAERRRIERNLHDGTQQRLVSLAINLGLVRDAVADAPPDVRDAVAAAHEEAKLALAELRGFIRGLHPAVLHERGLNAALSGIAARSAVPVRLSVSLPSRPPAPVEAVAYFVVSEALANVARHAGARTVDVTVARTADRLWLRVRDDGRGGADPAAGTGLRGLAQRVESLDGTLRVDSPPGGPTTIDAELPCGS